MVREFNICDTDRVIEIWMNGNADAHDFIEADYWEANAPLVKKELLQAEVYVYEIDGTIRGFIGIQKDYIAGIFVEREFRCMGIGRQLLNCVKKIHTTLSLNVYKRNERAVKFYLREGFSIILENKDQGDYTMSWKGRENKPLKDK